MSKYQLFFTNTARKDLKRLPLKVRERIFKKTDLLLENPLPQGSIAIKNSRNLFRIRVGIYRVVYSIETKVKIVSIVRIKHRKDAYRKL